MFILDTGSEGGAAGPFLAWSARGTQDGSVPPRNFYLRDGGVKTPMDATKGMVFDIETMKTGWQKSDGVKGVAPEWRWNQSPAQMMPCPGDTQEWKMGFSIKCAIGGGKVATWEQSGPGAFEALKKLAPQLSQQPARGQLPVVRMTDSLLLQFNKGSSVMPVLEVVKWVDRPDALKEGAAAGIALAPTPAPAPVPVQSAILDPEDQEF